MSDLEKRFIEELRALTKRSTQAEVARRSGLAQATVSRLLSGERLGNLETVLRIVQAYPELGQFLLPADMRKLHRGILGYGLEHEHPAGRRGRRRDVWGGKMALARILAVERGELALVASGGADDRTATELETVLCRTYLKEPSERRHFGAASTL